MSLDMFYEAIETRDKKHKILNEFSICNYLNENPDKHKDFVESRIRYLPEFERTSQWNGVNFYFKVYSTDLLILNDSDFSNKSNEKI